MNYILPNHFIDKSDDIISSNNIFCVKYISRLKNENICVRTTSHCIIILIKGKKILHLDNENICIYPNEIIFLCQNKYFMSEIITDDTYEAILIYFEDKAILDFMQKYNILTKNKDIKDIIKIDYSKDILYKNTIDILPEYIKQNISTNLLTLKLEEILLHSLRINNNFLEFLENIVSKSSYRLEHIIDSNIDLIHNAKDMYKILRLNPNYVRLYFKDKYNLTPKKYLDNKRLQKASALIKYTNKNISQIAQECGFATVSWFIAKFKEHSSLTPKEFRYKIS